jgi:hypothetical protein
MDEYLEWLTEQIELEAITVAHMVNGVMDNKIKFDQDAFKEAAHRHSAFAEARKMYEKFISKKSTEQA